MSQKQEGEGGECSIQTSILEKQWIISNSNKIRISLIASQKKLRQWSHNVHKIKIDKYF